MIPRLLGLERMYSIKLIDLHFWIATIGVVVYITSMWIAGVQQGLMWRATNGDGTLTYTFIESLAQTYPFYVSRLFGGLLVLSGSLIMAYNCWRTWASASARVAVPIPTAVAA